VLHQIPRNSLSRYVFRLRCRNGDYVCYGKMPAESSGHVQWRDNVVALPIPFCLSLAHVFALIPFRILIQVSTVRFPRPYSKCKEQKEGARAQRSHAAQIEAAG